MSTWQPGARPSAPPRWTVPVALLPDESITSWLVRAALVQGCDPPTLTGWIWPRWRLWTIDADRGISDTRLAALSRVSGIATDAFRAAGIEIVAARVWGKRPDPRTAWPWILTLGARNMKRSGGVQYCPACLHEDRTPHFRLQWRFAWHTGCDLHEVELIDRCPGCSAPIEPHRLPADARHLAICATCGADLRPGGAPPGDRTALSFQRAADQAVRAAAYPCFGEPVGTATWFAVADFLAGLVRRATHRPTAGLERLLDATGTVAPRRIAAEPGARIERMRVEDRRAILSAVWRLMQLRTDDLRRALSESGITRQGMCERGRDAPGPLAPLMHDLPQSAVAGPKRTRKAVTGPRARHEVLAMMHRLRRKLEAQGR